MRLLRAVLDLLTSQYVRVAGVSMLPALRGGQWVRCSRVAYRTLGPSRFDVVRFEAPVEGLRFDVKRVVGLPGELVELRDGRLYIDGEPVSSPASGGGDAAWATSDDEYIVLGDNREHSTDSRKYGVINRKAIRGRVREGGAV